MPDSRSAVVTGSPRIAIADVAFWLAAVLLLFWGLGHTGMWNSEDRWMEVAREMRLSGNYLRPTINGEVYFDKPLGGYWLVVLCSYLTGGVNEWALRLPSALSALLCLWATIDLGRRLWSEQTGRVAGWLLLTCYGVLMWARSGEADMENMAASILAVAWYWRVRGASSFLGYFIFYLIIFIGAQAKGLTAAVVPILVVLCDLLRGGRWRAQINIAHVAALLAGSAVYALPFMLAETPASGAAGDSGLLLVFRENVVRYFAPFDHDAPFYMYFPWLQVLWFPWLPILWGGIAGIFINYKNHDAATRWLIAAFAVVFLFFLLSGSRRIYYILPLLPYCALLMALFLQRTDLARLRNVLLRIQAAFLALAILLLTILPAVFPLWTKRAHIEMPSDFSLHATLVIGVLAALYWFLVGGLAGRPVLQSVFAFIDAQSRQRMATLLGVAVIVLGGFFLQIRIMLDNQRTQWPFARELKGLAQPLPAAQIAAVSKRVAAGLLYYAELPIGIGEFRRAEDVLRFAQTPPFPKLLIVDGGELAAVPDAIQQLPPVLVEQRQPWEKAHRDKNKDKKMRAWLIEAPVQ